MIFPPFSGSQKFITMFTTNLHWSLSSARLIQSINSPAYLSKLHLNIILPPTSRSPQQSLSLWLSHQNPISNQLRPHACYMYCPSLPPWLELYLTKSTSYVAPVYAVFSNLPSLHLSSVKYSPQHPVRKHPQSMFLPQCQRPSYTPMQNHRQNYSFLYSNFYIFRQQMRGQKVLDWMVASIIQIQSPLNFLLNQVLNLTVILI
jgi:hypothetical protein